MSLRNRQPAVRSDKRDLRGTGSLPRTWRVVAARRIATLAAASLLIAGCVATGSDGATQRRSDEVEPGPTTSQPTSQTASDGGVNVNLPVAANEHQRAVETHSNTTQTGAVPVSLSGNTGIAMTTTVGAGIVIVFIVTAALGAAFLGLQEWLSHVRDMARIQGLRERGIEGLRGGGA